MAERARGVDLGAELNSFRDEIREWLGANRVAELEVFERLSREERHGALQGIWKGPPELAPAYAEWDRRCDEAGYICTTWPVEYGGRAWTGTQMAIWNEELVRARMPRANRGIGEWLAAPCIIQHGTEEQKRHFLSRIRSNQDIYGQGFSEPNAGSDLAAVRCAGVVEGDEIVVSGQKTWTSGGAMANTIFVLCLTDPGARRHRGLSWVILPLTDNQATVRPIRQMTGTGEFTEEFFEGSRAPLFNVIGGLNNGWRVAMSTMGAERGANATTHHLAFTKEFWSLVAAARTAGTVDQPVARQRMAWSYERIEMMRFAGLRMLANLAGDRQPGPEASLGKLFSSEYHRRFGEIAMELLPAESLVRPSADGDDDYAVSEWQYSFLRSRAETIYAGSSQIQRNIIGERVLGLPRDSVPL